MFRKKIITFLIAVLIFSGCGGFFLASPAKAQGPTIEVSSIWQMAKDVIRAAASQALSSGLDYFARKMAYDLAMFTATGGKGQGPLAYDKNFATYLKDVGDAAAGVAIESFTKSVASEAFGEGMANNLNICNIPDLKVDLALKIGYSFKYGSEPPGPRCTFTQMQKNWVGEGFKSRFLEPGAVEKMFNVSLTAEDSNDFAISLLAKEKIDRIILEQVAQKTLERQEGGGYKAVEDLISGSIKTPAANVGNEAVQGNSAVNAKEQTEARANAATASAEPSTIIATYASIFIDTLAGQIYKNYKECGILVGTCPSLLAGSTAGGGNFGGTGRASNASVSSVFGKLLVSPIRQLDQYDVMTKYSSCSNPNNPGPEECIIDQKMVAALQQSAQGNLMTIGEAVERGILDGTKKLISPNNVLSYDANYCWTQGYCLSNVKKMRKARILPLGFEIAVAKSDPDRPWILQDVLKGFNDPTKPYYHLVDPNWVLKIPEARCDAMGYGTTLDPAISVRVEECVDLTSCVGYTKDGTCRDYAYCAREKNVWKFDGDACDAQFNSCRTFSDETGRNNVSYLYRTLNTKNCDQNNAGCASYSLSQNSAGAWQDVFSAGAVSNVTINNRNITVNLNGKLSTNCSANSDGCSAFMPASAEVDSTYLMLRKAPSFFNCYDKLPGNTIPDEWPVTRADLATMRPEPECANYAQVCLPDEVGCNWYRPVTYQGGDIPGRFAPATVVGDEITAWNDQCDAKCVGYSAYKEMPSNYANGNDLAYIIPSSGQTCSSIDEGCSSFTNLSTTVGGMEQTEYYSYLRPCIKPTEGQFKNYITYEGSIVGGFQLKTYTLEVDPTAVSDTEGKTGGPNYFYRTIADLPLYSAQCSKYLYENGLSSTDCREFNDEQGNTFYRLLSKTIAVSEQCTPYRLNNSEMYALSITEVANATACTALPNGGVWKDNQCHVCFSNGEYRDGFCFYNGLPNSVANNAGVSRSCSAGVNTCRAYKGNTGNNLRNIFSDDFEGEPAVALKDWAIINNSGTLSQSTESIRAGEHSLVYVGSTGVYKILSLIPGKSYDLTFWAKGEPQDLNVSLVDPADTNVSLLDFGKVGVGDDWRLYHLGPQELLNKDGVYLKFKSNTSARIFLDNVELKEMTDNIYLVKNTLKVDAVCDSIPTDNLPGEALGCAEYKDNNNVSFYLTNFSYLCRTSAVGCTALLDTKNTLDTDMAKVYNVWLNGPVSGASTASITINNTTVSCQIPQGDAGCYVNIVGADRATINSALSVANGVFNSSTIYIEEDTPATQPIYLVAEKKTSCNQVDLGCSLAGAEKLLPSGEKTFVTTTIKNDPALYEGLNAILCSAESVGCKKWTSNKGEAYFKDPAVVGGKICEFKMDIEKNNKKYSGWFWKDVGVCAGTTDNYCTNSNDCNGLACEGLGVQPCYPNYLVNGSYYDLYSFGDIGNYNNFVGTCPAEQNNCSEFVDHADNDAKYYYIDNDQVGAGDCGGEVSQKYGCVLLDKTNNPNKYYKTADSYVLSESQGSSKVAPVKAEDTTITTDLNDANAIVKVQRDRVCGEWLKCRDSHPVYDEKLGKWTTVCDSIGRCDKMPEATESLNVSECANWTDSEFADEVLTDSLYQNRRDTTWKGMDFSGYSLLNLYPLEELEQVDIDVGDEKDWRLVKRIPCGGQGREAIDPNVCATAEPENVTCLFEDANRQSVEGEECGLRGNPGVCMNGNCVQGVGGEITTDEVDKKSPDHECRAYPEKNSPFPNTLTVWNVAQNYSNVPICNGTSDIEDPVSDPESAIANACECDYTKVSYGNYGTDNKYFGFNNQVSILPTWVCVGGQKDNEKCDPAPSSPADGTTECEIGGGICQPKTKTTQFVGWRGACMEEDPLKSLNGDKNQHPCITWYPVDQLIGAPDINNQHTDAGFEQPDNFQPYYCLEATMYKNTQLSTFDPGCNMGQDGGTCLVCQECPILENVTLVKGPCAIYQNAPENCSITSSVLPENQRVFNGTCQCTYTDGNTSLWNEYTSGLSGALAGDYRAACKTAVSVEGLVSGITTVKAQTNNIWKKIVITNAAQVGTYNNIPNPNPKSVFYGNIPLVVNNSPLLITPWCSQSNSFYRPDQSLGLCGLTSSYPSYPNPQPLLGDGGRPYADFGGKDYEIPTAGITPEACRSDFQCPPYAKCEAGLCISRNETVQQAMEKLKNIFVTAFDVFKFDTINTAQKYVIDNSLLSKKDYAQDSGFGSAPKVISVGNCSRIDQCLEDDSSFGITINNKNSGDVILSNSSQAIMKFFAYADDNHMPIRRIKINWGDREVPLEGYFRNHRGLKDSGYCNSNLNKCQLYPQTSPINVTTNIECTTNDDCKNLEQCIPLAEGEGLFGHILNRTCDNAYFRFDHYYECTSAMPAAPAGPYHSSCPNTSITGGCCVFTPKVQVLDNWGWCNGTGCGSASSLGGEGCYDFECDSQDSAYTNFGGQIIVPVTE